MKADAVPLLAIFEKKMRLEVPLFQRQYVWSLEQQWEPLWEDVSRKFTEYLDGRKDAPVHFLGAMVLDQKQTPITHVEKRQIIDGQQRLTTLQIFLAAFRDFCRQQSCEDLAKECDTYTVNKGMMADPEIDKFKVWPTLLDRTQFMDVIGTGSREELMKKHPLVYKKYARKPQPRPRMVEAYLFFYGQLNEFFNGASSDEPLSADIPIAQRLEECFQALKNSLQVVAIDLAQEDDAQVIFETLNARGEPLLPADLLRNFIFLRAARRGEPQEELYKEFWQRFEEPFCFFDRAVTFSCNISLLADKKLIFQSNICLWSTNFGSKGSSHFLRSGMSLQHFPGKEKTSAGSSTRRKVILFTHWQRSSITSIYALHTPSC
jgi:hypothetical protein